MKKLLMICMCFILVACSSQTETQQKETVEETKKEESRYQKGENLTLGRYEQDGNINNGEEPIEWIVLKEKDGKITLISKYVLEIQTVLPMNSDDKFFDNTWTDGSERYWLNEIFLDNSFTEEEKSKLVEITLNNEESSFKKSGGKEISTNSEDNTKDIIYSISVEEFEKLVKGHDFAQPDYTDYVAYQSSYLTEPTIVYSTRSTNKDTEYPIIVGTDGTLNTCVPGTPGLIIGIRPVITIQE